MLTYRTSLSLSLMVAICLCLSLPVAAQFFGRSDDTNDAEETTSAAPGSFADLAERLLPSVVNISSTQRIEQRRGDMPDMPDMPQFPPGSPFEDFFEEFFNRRGGQPNMPTLPPASLGSGFIIDAENGYVITNNHVIRDADEIRVTLHDDTTLKAELIGMDEKTDIAVLKVESEEPLQGLTFGDSDEMRVGDWVIAIGNPFGLGGTVTAGIVSARQRDINAGPYDDFIQTDASINRGNSGGPMFNLDGQVIGINTAIFSPSGGSVGIGFAIPSALAEPVINQIIKYGRTRRGWLGVRIQTVTDEIAESLGLDSARGALVASVNEDSPASTAGIQAGDIILSFNNQDVEEMRALPRIVAETEIDIAVPVTVWREGQMVTVTVTVGELEKAEEEGLIETAESDDPADSSQENDDHLTLEEFGLTLAPLTPSLYERFDIAGTIEGLVITDVEDLSQAAEKGFLPGDVVVELNQTSVITIEDVEEALNAAQEEERNSVLFLLNRNGTVRFTALKLDQDNE